MLVILVMGIKKLSITTKTGYSALYSLLSFFSNRRIEEYQPKTSEQKNINTHTHHYIFLLKYETSIFTHYINYMNYTSEAQLQSKCFLWAWNNRPETRGLLCCNLNNSANKVQGNRNKSMGVIPGRADMVLYWEGRALHIEFKLPGGRQSRAQQKWQNAIEYAGFRYRIIRDEQGFRELIDGELAK